MLLLRVEPQDEAVDVELRPSLRQTPGSGRACNVGSPHFSDDALFAHRFVLVRIGRETA
jgi:hypothetical protein